MYFDLCFVCPLSDLMFYQAELVGPVAAAEFHSDFDSDIDFAYFSFSVDFANFYLILLLSPGILVFLITLVRISVFRC